MLDLLESKVNSFDLNSFWSVERCSVEEFLFQFLHRCLLAILIQIWEPNCSVLTQQQIGQVLYFVSTPNSLYNTKLQVYIVISLFTWIKLKLLC